MIEKILKIIDKISMYAGIVSAILIGIAMILLVPEVISRYFFNHSFMFIHDVATWLCGAMYVLGGGYTLLKNGHVNVDVIYSKFSSRKQAFLDVIGFPVFLAFCLPLAWEGSKLFFDSFKVLEKTVTPWGGPVWLFKLMLPIGTTVLLFQGLANFIRRLKVAIGKDK